MQENIALNLETEVASTTESTNDFIPCRPFLKWAGGKRQLYSQIASRLPTSFNRYFEPFLGGGAAFFGLQPKEAFLSDTNSELVTAFNAVKNNLEELVQELTIHSEKHGKDYFYELRDIDRKDNPQHEKFLSWSETQRAARTIYLNKTCFNGLYRVNSRGEFNVPFGDYSSPKIADAENLKLASLALKHANIKASAFLDMESEIKKGDFVYLDPPYIPLSTSSSFTSYTADRFGNREHIDLKNFCQRISEKGAFFLLSNSYTTLTLDLYRNFKVGTLKASRAINSAATKRGKILEVLVSNY